MTDFILNYALNWLWSMVAWFFHSIGIGGIAVFVAACLAAISLSANTVKFLSRPKGLATSAAVLIAGAAYAWWMWPVPAASVPGPSRSSGSPAGTVSQPDAILAKREAVPKATAVLAKPLGKSVVKRIYPEPEMVPWIAPAPAVVAVPFPTVGTIPVPQARHGGMPLHGSHRQGTSSTKSETHLSHPQAAAAGRAGGSSPQASQPSHSTPPRKPGTIASTSGQRSSRPAGPTVFPLIGTNPGLRRSGPVMPSGMTPAQQRKWAWHQKTLAFERQHGSGWGYGGGGTGLGMPHMGGMGHSGGMPHHGGHH